LTANQNNNKNLIQKTELPKTPERLVFIPKTFDDLEIVSNSKKYCREKKLEQHDFLLDALTHHLRRLNYPPNLQLSLFNYQEHIDPTPKCNFSECGNKAIAEGEYRGDKKRYKLCYRHYMLIQTGNSLDWRELKMLSEGVLKV
jgi:hypothetical protein